MSKALKIHDPFIAIVKWKIKKQSEVGEKPRKFGGWMFDINWWVDKEDSMKLKKILIFVKDVTKSSFVDISITVNKLKEDKKWDYTYSYMYKDIENDDNFLVVDYCREVSKKELNKFAKKKIF